MADDVVLSPGVGGDTIAADDIAGIKYQRVKVNWGADGATNDTAAGAAAMPIQDGGNTITVDGTVTSNAGTNLNTSLLALEAGGNLAAILAKVTVGSASITKAEDAIAGSGDAGVMVLAVRQDALAVLAADADYIPLVVNASGRLYTASTIDAAIPAGNNNIGDVDVASLPALAAGNNNIGDVDVASVPAPLSTTGGGTEAAALRVTLANNSTGVVQANAGTNLNTSLLALEAGGNLALQTTALQLIDDTVYTDDTSTHATGTSKGIGIMAAATPTDAAVSANDIGMVAMTTDRKLHVAVMDAIPAGNNNIGDVDVASVTGNVTVIQGTATNLKAQAEAYQGGSAVAAGNPLNVTLANGSVPSHAVTNAGTFAVQPGPSTTGGELNYSALSTAAVVSAEIKGSAGQFYDIQGFNKGTAAVYVRMYNQTGAPASGDTANIVWRGIIPGTFGGTGAGFVVPIPFGRTCGTGIGIRVTAAIADNDNTSLNANEVTINVGYK